MDTPALIILLSIIATLLTAIQLRYFFHTPLLRASNILFFTTSAIWLVVVLCGEFFYSWAGNTTCSAYLGCVNGFLGYDAFEHLLFGIALALGLIWISKRYPRYSVLSDELWKVVLMIVAIVALVSVMWEIVECAHDALRVDIFHQPLRNIRLRINLLDQPSNIDTMGDLTMSLVGGIVGVFLLKKKD